MSWSSSYLLRARFSCSNNQGQERVCVPQAQATSPWPKHAVVCFSLKLKQGKVAIACARSQPLTVIRAQDPPPSRTHQPIP